MMRIRAPVRQKYGGQGGGSVGYWERERAMRLWTYLIMVVGVSEEEEC